MSNPYQPYPQSQPGGYGQGPDPQAGWEASPQGYLQGAPASFGEAISEGFKNIVTFTGRASRSAFWWFILAGFIIDLIGSGIGNATHALAITYVVDVIVALATLAVSVRRLHDSGRSGFWWFLAFIPIIGGIILIVFYCLPGTPGPNKYDQ